MLSTKKAKFLLSILVPVLIAVFSIGILAQTIPETKFVQESVSSIEDSKMTVMEFTGATLATSVAITALPDDFASPIASELAGMDKYFILILMVLFVEKLMAFEGIKIAFKVIIPIACGLFLIAILSKKDIFKSISYRIGLLGLALVLVVPVSTHLTNSVCAEYLEYVNDTIDEAKTGANKINEISQSDVDNQTMFDKLSNAFSTAMAGINDLLAYFNNVIKKCMNSIAILVVTTIVMPLIVFWFFTWILKGLFNYNNTVSLLRRHLIK